MQHHDTLIKAWFRVRPYQVICAPLCSARSLKIEIWFVPTRAGKNDCPTKTVKSVEQPFDALQELSKPWNKKYASNFRNREQTQ
jgi:hypothetical protein